MSPMILNLLIAGSFAAVGGLSHYLYTKATVPAGTAVPTPPIGQGGILAMLFNAIQEHKDAAAKTALANGLAAHVTAPVVVAPAVSGGIDLNALLQQLLAQVLTPAPVAPPVPVK